MPVKSLSITCLSLLFSSWLFALRLPIKHYTAENGLLSNTAFSLFFDSKSYLWIASDKGLERFNGKEFTKFTITDGLPDNEVFGLTEDNEGRIWITTLKGVLCYFKDNTFYTATTTSWLKLKEGKTSSFYNHFLLQKDGSLLTTSDDGRYMLEIKKERLKVIPIRSLWTAGISNDPAITYNKRGDNIYEVFYNHHSFIIDSLGQILKQNVYRDSSLTVACLSPELPYLASQNGVYDLTQKMVWPEKLDVVDRNFLFPFLRIGKGHFFLGTNDGLLLGKTRVALKGNRITALDRDNLGNIWASTLENGIFCLSKDFENIDIKPVPDKIIATVQRDSAFDFFTGNGSLFNTRYSKPIYTVSLPKRFDKGKSFTHATFCLTKSGDMLWGHNYEFFYKTRKSPGFKRIFIDSSINIGYPVKAIYHLNDRFYIAYRGSLLIIPTIEFKKHDTLQASKFLVYKTDNLARIYATSLNEADSSFWFSILNETYSFKNGIISVHPKLHGYTFRQFGFYKNYLLGCTDDNKLFIYNTRSMLLGIIPNSNSVWENIYPIDDHTAIISTDNYYKILILYSTDTSGKIRYQLKGLENSFLPSQADYLFGSRNKFYFQRDGILTGISTTLLLGEKVPPEPLFVLLKTDKKNYPIRAVISVPFDDAKHIGIPIDVVDYNNVELITQYSISKNGNETKWNAITGNEINLNEAGYGRYNIKLRSKRASGNFSKTVSILLIIQKPFWAKWWFLFLSFVIFLLIIFVSIQFIARRQIRKKQMIYDAELKFQQSEYKALNALMNPHFIFNSLNSIQSLINRGLAEIANQYLVVFSRLIRQNMVNVSKGSVSLHRELELVENYLGLEKLRFKDYINYSIDVDDEVDTEGIMIPPLLIQPLVENAVIHGLLPKQSLDNMIRIKVSEKGDTILIEIKDNGIGLTKSLETKKGNHESYGLSNLHRRIEHLKKLQNRHIDFDLEETFDKNGHIIGTTASLSITS